MNPRQSYADWRLELLGVFERRKSEREFYWILDSCSHPELPGILWKLEADPRARPLYMNTYLEEVSSAGPYILPVEGNPDITSWVFGQSGEKPLGCLAEIVPGAYAAAFEQLQWQLECRPGGSAPAMFRWYDPRMLYGMGTWPETQSIVGRFMGPVLFLHAWEPGRCSDIVWGTGMDSGHRSAAPEEYPESLFDHIWNEAMIHGIIGTLGHLPGKLLREMPLPQAYELGERAALAIMAAGYDDMISLAHAMAVTVMHGPSFWDDPRVAAALAGRPEKAPLMEVLDEICSL